MKMKPIKVELKSGASLALIPCEARLLIMLLLVRPCGSQARVNRAESLYICIYIYIYYMEKSVLLGTKPLVDSIHHFIRDPSGVFSVCHLCECRIVH